MTMFNYMPILHLPDRSNPPQSGFKVKGFIRVEVGWYTSRESSILASTIALPIGSHFEVGCLDFG